MQHRAKKPTIIVPSTTDSETAYSLITVYDSASYGPNDTITREQAMAILARAMKLTGLSTSHTDSDTSALQAKYTDGASASEYAKTSAAMCLNTGVVTGSSATTLSPKAYVTRAEVAVMVQRLLQKSGLIQRQYLKRYTQSKRDSFASCLSRYLNKN